MKRAQENQAEPAEASPGAEVARAAPLNMRVQHALKNAVKPLLFKDAEAPRSVKSGPGRGVVVLLNRRRDLQREFGLYERELHEIYRRLVRPGTIVYDIGAADGLEALTFAALGAHVIAFEPSPDAIARLEQNLALNPEVVITVVAAPYAPGLAPLPDFVKIDVDGAEVSVLKSLPQRPRSLVVETHSEKLEAACRTLLLAQGYDIQTVRNAWWRRFYPEWRPSDFNRWLVATLPPAPRS
jgi:precorrin-6B methylase 2